MPKRLPEEICARVIALREEGVPLADIRQQLNLDRTTVYRILNRPLVAAPRASMQRDRAPEILKCYFEGKSIYEVAEELGISKSTVHRAVAEVDAIRPVKGSKNPGVALARRKSVIKDGLKFCTSCEGWFPPERFPPSKISLDGRRPACLKCHQAQQNTWYQTPAGRLYKRIKSNSYSHRVREATPKWLTREQRNAINKVYMEAVNRQLATGAPHHVDHIIPINGKDVSGLHVPANLQVVLGEENCRKGNKYTS